jgi:hypothetical protein
MRTSKPPRDSYGRSRLLHWMLLRHGACANTNHSLPVCAGCAITNQSSRHAYIVVHCGGSASARPLNQSHWRNGGASRHLRIYISAPNKSSKSSNALILAYLALFSTHLAWLQVGLQGIGYLPRPSEGVIPTQKRMRFRKDLGFERIGPGIVRTHYLTIHRVHQSSLGYPTLFSSLALLFQPSSPFPA